MNPESTPTNFAPVSADERWIDAALSEHARLGKGDDEELVFRILQETVHRRDPARTPKTVLGDRRLFFIATGSIAASVALALVMLSRQSPAPSERRSDELRFVIRVASPESTGATAVNTPPRAAVTRHTGPLALTNPAPAPSAPAAAPTLATSAFEWVTEFGPSFAPLPRAALRGERLRITADRSESTPSGLRYEGDVLVEHDSFRIEATRVNLPDAGTVSGDDKAALLAYQVRVARPADDCFAEAAELRFEPATGELVLTGITRVRTDRGELARFSPGDRLVLSEGGFRIETAPMERSASPLPHTR